MHRRIFCFVFLLIAFFLKSDSLIIDGDESTIRSHLESTLKHDNSTIPSLLLLSMPMQFHYSASILHLRYRLDAMLLLADSLRQKYDITIGIFTTVSYAEQGDHYKYKVSMDYYVDFRCLILANFQFLNRS